MGSLITGIGYVGSRLAEMLLDSGESVVGIDNLFSTDLSCIQQLVSRKGFTFVRGDVSDTEAVREVFDSGVQIETVYHLAAQASADPSAAPARYTEITNLVGPRVVLDAAVAHGASTFVFSSSIQVYGRKPLGRVDESTPYGPILDIAHLSKPYVEKLMEMYSETRGLRCVAARLALVYGLGPVVKTDPRFMTAPNKFCMIAAKGGRIRIDSSALHPTSLIHVDDAALGLMALGSGGKTGYSAVNLLGETGSVADVGGLVRDLAFRRGLEVELAEPENGLVDPACEFRSVMDRSGFAPKRALEEGLAEVLDYFVEGQNRAAAGVDIQAVEVGDRSQASMSREEDRRLASL